MNIDYPVQIYSFVFPKPEAGNKDLKAYNMLMSLLFTDDNSILNNKIVEKEKLAFGIYGTSGEDMIYPSYQVIDVIMSPMPGNVKVKKEIRKEINNVIDSGITQQKIDKFTLALESAYTLQDYEPSNVAYRLGVAEFFYHDPFKAAKEVEEYKKITSADLKAVAAKYLSDEAIQFINIKPSF